MPEQDAAAASVLRGLAAASSSVRLQAAMAIGSSPDPRHVDALVQRCAAEPDFYVRDMLTWALTRCPASVTVPRLISEIAADGPQARSQALHTLCKIADRSAWPVITPALLTDADDEVARSAWRAAAVLVPGGQKAGLARVLVTQLGRGGREVQLSLSRALIALGEVIVPALRTAMASGDPRVRQHAAATRRLAADPDAGFEPAVTEARRIVALGPASQQD